MVIGNSVITIRHKIESGSFNVSLWIREYQINLCIIRKLYVSKRSNAFKLKEELTYRHNYQIHTYSWRISWKLDTRILDRSQKYTKLLFSLEEMQFSATQTKFILSNLSYLICKVGFKRRAIIIYSI